jgi:hypothetical protein
MATLTTSAGEWHVGPTSRLAWGPRHPEDGERREVEVYFVMVEAPNGERWLSQRSFGSAEAAARCVPAVRRRLARGERPEGSAHWTPTWPMYGSEAYADGAAEEIAAEKKADEDGTFYDGGIFG